jgi:hypothetical protein
MKVSYPSNTTDSAKKLEGRLVGLSEKEESWFETFLPN